MAWATMVENGAWTKLRLNDGQFLFNVVAL